MVGPVAEPAAGAGATGSRPAAVVLDWLARCRSGGLQLTTGSKRYVPWPEVLADVSAVADRLRARGVRPGMRIGVRGENSYEWVLLDLALLRVGAVAVAFAPGDFKGVSNADLVRRYGLAAIYCARRERGGDEPSTVTALEALREAAAPVRPVAAPPDGDADAFTLVFSSGTAGTLKCLRVSWRGCERLVEAWEDAYPFAGGDRILVALPLATFQQRYLVYLAIHNDCDVVLADTARLLRALRETQPTILLGPPSFFEIAELHFANAGRLRRSAAAVAAAATRLVPVGAARRRLRRAAFAPLHALYGGAMRLMLVGSAPVHTSTLELFRRAGLPLLEIYGMTESGYIAWNTPEANRIGTVGRPTHPGTVSLAADGEVLVRHSWHLCSGYEDAPPELSASVFCGDGVVATGDLGEFDEDGYLRLRGRKKNLLVTRGGTKVQLEELEAAICAAAGIGWAAVFERSDGAGLAVAAWYLGDRAAARLAVAERARDLNARLPLGLQIRSGVLVAGALDPDSPLLNRNLKLDRGAVQRELEARLETLPA